MKTIKSRLMMLAISLATAASVTFAAPASWSPDTAGDAQTNNKIRKELVTLPYYGVFDNLAYEVQGNTVILSGQVVRPTTRKDAERRIARIEGIDRVVNNIEVLPVSGFDDSIRVSAYRAVFGGGSNYRYAMGANPSIHIVVNRGHITLEGIVSNRMDSQLAYMAANRVPGVFSVTNNLRVASGS
jgi:hyperosmotically inducible periplasmic protein